MPAVLSVFLLSIVLAASALAQTSATLAGQALDATDRALPGASVTLTSVETSIGRTVTADAAGRFVITGLAAGEYSLRAEFPGFRPRLPETARRAWEKRR